MVPAIPNFASPAEAARAWAPEYEQRQAAKQKLIQAQPKIAVAERVESHLRTSASVIRTFEDVNSVKIK